MMPDSRIIFSLLSFLRAFLNAKTPITASNTDSYANSIRARKKMCGSLDLRLETQKRVSLMHSSQNQIQSIHPIAGCRQHEPGSVPAAPVDVGLISHSNPKLKTPKEETP